MKSQTSPNKIKRRSFFASVGAAVATIAASPIAPKLRELLSVREMSGPGWLLGVIKSHEEDYEFVTLRFSGAIQCKPVFEEIVDRWESDGWCLHSGSWTYDFRSMAAEVKLNKSKSPFWI